MSGHMGDGSPTPAGLLGTLRSWLREWSGRLWSLLEADALQATKQTAHFYGSVRVMVVDDNPVNLMVVSAMLESRGLVPWLADDGAEAVALACELPFDFILMDLQMPVLNGLEATSAIRRFERGSALPPVPVIAYTSTTPAAEALAAHGFSGNLPKPCEDQALEDCLVRWCPNYRPAPALRHVAEGNGRWHGAAPPTGAHSPSLH